MVKKRSASVFEDAHKKIEEIKENFIAYRSSEEGKGVAVNAVAILKESINLLERADRRICEYEKFLYFAGKGDTLFFVNNETGEITRGSIEQVLKATRDIKEVLK